MTTEIIEGDAREERALALRPSTSAIESAGATALAEMSDVEFEARLAQIKKGRERVDRIHRELMREGVDYGVIPGTKSPTLLQPGAQILCQAYKLVPEFQALTEHGDGVTRPALRIVSRCLLHLGSLDGPVVGDGDGAANSWEPRYRYRQGERTCPKCGVVGTVIKGKDEYGGGYICWKKKGGCGAKFDDGDVAIESQEVGQVENPDPYSLDETLVQIADKRSHVAATRRALAISGLFTQDVEDMDAESRRETRPTRQSASRPRAETRRLTLTGRVVVEDGDFVPRQYPQGWAILFHLAVQGPEGEGPARIIVTHTDMDALPRFDEGATVRVEGEWQARQNAVVASSVSLISDASDDIDVMGFDEEPSH